MMPAITRSAVLAAAVPDLQNGGSAATRVFLPAPGPDVSRGRRGALPLRGRAEGLAGGGEGLRLRDGALVAALAEDGETLRERLDRRGRPGGATRGSSRGPPRPPRPDEPRGTPR